MNVTVDTLPPDFVEDIRLCPHLDAPEDWYIEVLASEVATGRRYDPPYQLCTECRQQLEAADEQFARGCGVAVADLEGATLRGLVRSVTYDTYHQRFVVRLFPRAIAFISREQVDLFRDENGSIAWLVGKWMHIVLTGDATFWGHWDYKPNVVERLYVGLMAHASSVSRTLSRKTRGVSLLPYVRRTGAKGWLLDRRDMLRERYHRLLSAWERDLDETWL